MAISSRVAKELAKGSTTRARSPDRTVKPHERAAVRHCTQCKATKPIDRFSARQAWCKDCINAYSKEHYQRNRKKVLANKVKYRAENVGAIKALNAKWRADNADRVRQYLSEYRQANRADLLAKKKLAHPAYYAKNKAKYLAKFIARREWKERAQPKWADLKAMEAVYEMAREKTLSTGIFYEVDHIVPLNNRAVCGLHVEINLRIISRDENRQKSNRLIEDIV